MVRRVAALEGVDDQPDWEAWYRGKYKKAPDYSEILDALAKTPTERRAILHGYIEPKDGEDARKPTKAHRAIARLVKDGFIRLIVTTNFDRLIENALREEGIEPTVIASEDALAGATPLTHTKCTVVKLHGDYLDSRIRNIDSELSEYAPAIDRLLDEVFDRFGLVVAGWSGEWDEALRAAIIRAPNRRYPLFWVARGGKVGASGQDIIDHRGGRLISIVDADDFFVRVEASVGALRQADRPHPQSVALAVALAKRYCRDDKYAMEWAEFLAEEIAKVRAFIGGKDYPKDRPTSESLNATVAKLVAQSEILRRACMICGRWGTQQALRSAVRAIRGIGFKAEPQGGFNYWIDLREFPASLCFYWTLVGALRGTTCRLLALL